MQASFVALSGHRRNGSSIAKTQREGSRMLNTRWLHLLGAGALLLAALANPRSAAVAEPGDGPDVVPGRLVVGFRPGVSAAEGRRVVAAHGSRTVDELPTL